MDQHDRAAMQAAIEELLQLEPTWSVTIADMLQAQSFAQVGAFASGVCQARALKLRPHECTPADTDNVKDPFDRYGCRPNEVALLRRMLAAGVSRYHPDPMQALAALERAA
jgi:hypothetical protein